MLINTKKQLFLYLKQQTNRTKSWCQFQLFFLNSPLTNVDQHDFTASEKRRCKFLQSEITEYFRNTVKCNKKFNLQYNLLINEKLFLTDTSLKLFWVSSQTYLFYLKNYPGSLRIEKMFHFGGR